MRVDWPSPSPNLEHVGNGRLWVEAILHVDVHARRVRTVPQPSVASLVRALRPLGVKWVAVERLTPREDLQRCGAREHDTWVRVGVRVGVRVRVRVRA